MLTYVRKHADSWMIKAVLWAVVFTFVGTIFYSWGMGGTTEARGRILATVQGHKISYTEYERTFNNLIEFYKEQFRDRFSREMIEKLNIKTLALDGLIHKKLLLLEAEKHRIRASDAELAERIKSFPAFQKDNSFNQNLYASYLKYRHLTPREFESGQREALVLEKIENFIKSQEKVAAEEVLEVFKKEEDKIKIDYLVIPEDHFRSNEAVPEEEKKNYYEKNKDSFQIPEQVNAQYIKLAHRDFQSKAAVSEDEIQEYYKAQTGKFYEERQFRARHILAHVEPPAKDASVPDEERKKKQAEAEAAGKQRAEDILKRVKSGEDFAELAKSLSDDKASAVMGGDLGYFPLGTMVPEFEKAVTKLKPGEVSEPVLSAFGWHIIKLDEVKEAYTRPLEKVRETILTTLKESKARQLAQRVAKHVARAAETDKDLDRAAKAEGVEVKTTGFITRQNHNVPDLGAAPEFFNTLFSLAENEVSAPVHSAETSYVIKLTDKKAAFVPAQADIADAVERAALAEKSRNLTAENVKALEQQAVKNQDVEALAASLKLEVKRTPLFSSQDSIPGMGDLKAVKEKAFALEKGQVAMVLARRNYYLFKIADRLSAAAPDEAQRKAIYARLQKEKGDAAFGAWLEKLKESSDIMIDKTML